MWTFNLEKKKKHFLDEVALSGHLPSKGLKNPSVSKLAEMGDFCGFTREQILEASTKKQRRLCVLSRNTRDLGTFEGFDAMEIRNNKRINEEENCSSQKGCHHLRY